jgi:hypothetical protein
MFCGIILKNVGLLWRHLRAWEFILDLTNRIAIVNIEIFKEISCKSGQIYPAKLKT